jgi:hypothetical protein
MLSNGNGGWRDPPVGFGSARKELGVAQSLQVQTQSVIARKGILVITMLIRCLGFAGITLIQVKFLDC